MSVKIHKKGSRINLPIGYNFQYKVLTPRGYEKPIARQEISFKSDLVVVELENKSTLKTTPDHPHIIFNNDKEVECPADLLALGNILKMRDGSFSKISKLTREPFAGIVYDFTMPSEKFFANNVLTHNCRLQLDLNLLRKRGGGLFGADEFTGSMGVVTINLPQLAFLAIDEQDFFERLTYLMDLAKQSLLLKRKKVTELNNMGMFPYTKRFLSSFRNHFNTIGICGMNEACLNFFNKPISTLEGKAFAEKVLYFMRDKMLHYQEETRELFNLEATPAESTSYRLAKHDKKNYPAIVASGEKEPYYTNSSQLPVDYTEDVFEALDLQESLQVKYTGGTVFHAMLGERISDWTVTKELVKSIAHNYKIPYFTLSPVYSICPVHGYLDGEHEFCFKCKEEKIKRIDAQIASLKSTEEFNYITMEKN